MQLEDKIAKTVLPKSRLATNAPKVAGDGLAKKESEDYQSVGTVDAESLNELKNAAAQTQIRLRQVHIDGLRQDQMLRDKYANKAYIFVWVWSVMLFFLLVISGTKGFLGFDFVLSDPVLLALITGVTVNILTVFLSVMYNLFPKKPEMNRKTAGKKPTA